MHLLEQLPSPLAVTLNISNMLNVERQGHMGQDWSHRFDDKLCKIFHSLDMTQW